MKVNRKLSEQLAEKIELNVSQCYHNSYQAMWEMPGSIYVEGWAVVDSWPIEHGWLEIDNQVVDVTLHGDDVFYFPALRFNAKEVAEAILKGNGELPFFYQYGHGGRDSPEMVKAYQSAKDQSALDMAREQKK